MPKKAPSIKNRIWERERRIRFNASFTKLASLLPQSDSKTLSKVLIIQKAAELIEQLQEKISTNQNETVSKLQNEISELNQKCSILTKIINEAGVQIPNTLVAKNGNIEHIIENNILKQNNIKTNGNQDDKTNLEQNVQKDAQKESANETCTNKETDTSVVVSNKDDTVKNKIVNKVQKKGASRPADKINDPSKLQLTTNSNLQNMCPIVIIVNDSQSNTQPQINGLKLPTALTIIKNAAIPNAKTGSRPVKMLQNVPVNKKCGNKQIASKALKLSPSNAMFLNKVPIPALNSSPPKGTALSLEKKLGKKPKQEKVTRVTYRMLRKSKILKKRVIEKKVNDKQIGKSSLLQKTEAVGQLQVIEETKQNDVNKNIDNIDKDIISDKNSNDANDKKVNNESSSNKTSATSTVTYSIDSICNAGMKMDNLIPSTSKIENSVQICDKVNDIKKGLRSPCIDNNSKYDPMLSDLSNDIFASLPMVNHQAGCTSPTAAFLLAFPLVSSLNGGKVNHVVMDDGSETQETSNALLQIANQKAVPDNNPGSNNLLNLDQFSTLFTSKELYKNHNKTPKVNSIKNLTKVAKTSENDTTNNKTNVNCLYTYGNSNSCLGVQNSAYNSCFEVSNKDEKNKFSHTNIITDNSISLPCLSNIQEVTSTNLQSQYGTEMNCTQAKTSSVASTNLTYSMAVPQSESSLAPSYNNMKSIYSESQHFYSAYPSFHNNKDKLGYIPSTSVAPTFNTDAKLHTNNSFETQNDTRSQNCNSLFSDKNNTCSNNVEKTKTEINYQQQDNKYSKDVSMRYKPYAFNANTNDSKIKRHDSIKDNMKDHSQSIKPPVNWMTSPDIRPNNCTLPKLNIQNSNYNYNNIDFSLPSTNEVKEPFFIVPPNNMNDNLNMWNNGMKLPENQTQLNLPTTLPTLIGDLALGNTTSFQQNNIKQYTSCFKDKKDSNTMQKEQMDKNVNTKTNEIAIHNNTWSNNFSVSQLVEQYKSAKDVPIPSNDKRQYACNKQKYLSADIKKSIKYEEDICSMMESVNNESDLFNKSNDHSTFTSKGNKKYSAEALLSDDTKHDLNVNSYRQQQFFPFVDFSTDLHQSTSKFNKQHTKISEANNSYPYPSAANNYSYAKNNTVINNVDMNSLGNKLLNLSNQSDMQTPQHLSDNYKSNMYRHADNKNNPNASNIYGKKSSKKNKLQENNMIDFNYLPGNHSPVFTEDSFYNYSLYTSNAPAQSYQNQNLLYSGNVRSHINQHHGLPAFSSQISGTASISKNMNNTHIPAPSPSITNNSSSLTNFNLSTIFPEINDKVRSGW